jgi:hypothetical protein
MFQVGESPKTVHYVREKTILGHLGLEQFFLSQNGQFSDFLLYVTKICIISSLPVEITLELEIICSIAFLD